MTSRGYLLRPNTTLLRPEAIRATQCPIRQQESQIERSIRYQPILSTIFVVMLAALFRNILDRNNRWQWWFWGIVMFMAPASALLTGDQSLAEAIVFRAVGLVGKMLAAYFLAYFLIPKTLYQKKYFLFTLSIPPTIFVFTVIARFLNVHVAEAVFFTDPNKESLWQIVQEWEFTMSLYFDRVFLFALWFTFLKTGVDHFRSNEKIGQLQQEKANAELSLLKAQIHPHFLFNTLNNLYILTLEKSEEAPAVVERLSEMLDYQLYQCNAPTIEVSKEIALISNYIQLESLRYGNRLRLRFKHAVDNPRAMVAPLILISPVENAFKHGASGNSDSPFIDITLTVKSGELHFTVRNNKPTQATKDNTQYTEGIGLRNIRKQLKLLYPNRHQLQVEETANEFLLILAITL